MNNPYLSCHLTSRFLLVARQHPHFDALLVQFFDCLYGSGFQSIRNGKDTPCLLFICQSNDRLGFCYPFLGFGLQRRFNGDTFFLQQSQVADIIFLTVNKTFHTSTYQNIEVFNLKHRSVFQKLHHGFCQRMLGLLFQTIQNDPRLCFISQPNGIRHLRMSFGQCSRLIQDYRIDLLSYLEAFGILNQNTILRSFTNTDHDSRRCSQSQSTRTSDNQYRNQSQHAMRKSVFRSQQNPYNQR